MLKARIITACFLIPIVLWLLFFASPLVFLGGTIVILLLASWEWSRLIGLTHVGLRFLYFYIVCLISPVVFILNPLWTLSASFIWWCLAFFLILYYPRFTSWHTVFLRGVMGILVLLPCVIALNMLRSNGAYLVFYLLTLIWLADTAAYFVGRRFGVTKLLPLVSPGKSVQGLLGALLAAFLYSFAWALCYSHSLAPLPIVFFIGLSVLTVLFSVIGDLFESMLKREVGLKDSGKLLPGHGGILDRIDSLTAALPVFLLGMTLFK
jgi:phosphatidate cytidylyltransferase